MLKPYPYTLLKSTIVNDIEIKAGTLLLIQLYEGESPDKFYLNIERAISRLSFVGSPELITRAPLREFYQLIKWQVKK